MLNLFSILDSKVTPYAVLLLCVYLQLMAKRQLCICSQSHLCSHYLHDLILALFLSMSVSCQLHREETHHSSIFDHLLIMLYIHVHAVLFQPMLFLRYFVVWSCHEQSISLILQVGKGSELYNSFQEGQPLRTEK